MTTTTAPAALLDAICDRDFDALASCLAPDAALRAVLPPRIVEAAGADEILRWFRRWYDTDHQVDLIDCELADVVGRARLSWRFRVAAHPVNGDPGPHLIEQVSYCDVEAGRITRIDLLCSGFRPC
jgi:hypothetical protein